MGTDQIMYCIVALILGMLLANMLKSVCGCKNVEGFVITEQCNEPNDGMTCKFNEHIKQYFTETANNLAKDRCKTHMDSVSCLADTLSDEIDPDDISGRGKHSFTFVEVGPTCNGQPWTDDVSTAFYNRSDMLATEQHCLWTEGTCTGGDTQLQGLTTEPHCNANNGHFETSSTYVPVSQKVTDSSKLRTRNYCIVDGPNKPAGGTIRYCNPAPPSGGG